jgi:hypothetical protein
MAGKLAKPLRLRRLRRSGTQPDKQAVTEQWIVSLAVMGTCMDEGSLNAWTHWFAVDDLAEIRLQR